MSAPTVLAPEFFEREIQSQSFLYDPFPMYKALQIHAPVYWSTALQAWLISKHDDVLELLRDRERLTAFGFEMDFFDKMPNARSLMPTAYTNYEARGLINNDPPDHTAIRRIVADAFTPRTIATWTPSIERAVDECIDRWRAQDEAEFVSTFAKRIPSIIISELIGADSSDADVTTPWVEELTSFIGSVVPDQSRALVYEQAMANMHDYLRELFTALHAQPKHRSVFAELLAANSNREISDDVLLNLGVLFFVAGYETTASLIAKGMLALFTHPSQHQRVLQDENLLVGAVEEMMRWEPSVQRVKRIATVDFDLRDQHIKRGDVVIPLIAAANRDPDVFADPDRFEIGRDCRDAVAFGHGIHHCLGAALAREEARVAFRQLGRRVGGLRLASNAVPEWRVTLTQRAVVALDVQWDSIDAASGRA